MILLIPDMLTDAEVDTIRNGLKTATYVDGATTAGGAAREVKRNQQMSPRCQEYEPLANIIRTAYLRNPLLQTALLPASATHVIFNRYSQGMEYGPHVDAPLMGSKGDLMRTDIALTLFLSSPDSYVGGELVTDSGGGIGHKFKEKAGSAITYPANTLHHVASVTQGTRDAAILWVQSLVRDPLKRELLWDLEQAEQDIYGREGRTAAFNAINRAHKNLMRRWAEK
ncbi:MAG TPA: Fe2+-dependent dioxygenase [Rhodanobacteraceae bacterium]|nr:Fe2+-dependent dioxygenase [Rhodanobacteraceae bacterium]